MGVSRRNLYILTFVLFVVMLGYGIIIPILPFYVERMGAGGAELGLLVASYALMRLICGPLWGCLSDRVGRKPILIVGILGYAITMVWFGLATQLWMLFAARILSGVLSSASAPTTMAYIGDSTAGEERGAGMGLLGAASGVGTIMGPVLSGFLGEVSLSTPFFVAAAMSVLALVMAWVILPESLSKEARRGPAESAAEGAAEGGRRSSLHTGLGIGRGPLGLLFALTFISTSGLMMFAAIFGLYALERFGYGPQQVGVVMMVLGLASAVSQAGLAGPLTRRWGDPAVIRGSFLAASLGFVWMLLANSYPAVLVSTAFFGTAVALQVPALISQTSKRTTAPQGATMGMSNSFISLGRIFGPLVAGAIFDIHASLPYLGGAATMLGGFAVCLLRSGREGGNN